MSTSVSNRRLHAWSGEANQRKLLLDCLCAVLLVATVLAGRLSAAAQAGRLDSAFGQGGKVVTNVPGGSNAVAAAAVIQNDGKIVVAGGLGTGQAIGLINSSTPARRD